MKTIMVSKKVSNKEIQLLVSADDRLITDESLALTPQSEMFTAYVPEIDGARNFYTVTTSNAKILDVYRDAENNCWEFTPKGVGTVTITVAINDGSGVKQTFKVKVGSVAVPVNSIDVSTKTLYMQKDRDVALTVKLNGKNGNIPTVQDVEWVISDPSVVDFVSAETAGKYITTSHEDYLELTAKANGKVTITGTTLDGSKKTVKITVNVVAPNKYQVAQGIMITPPANAPTNYTGDKTMVVWGKSMQLKATLKPTTSQNKTIVWEVVDKVTGQPVDGITIKNGKLTVASASAKLTPFTGVVEVRAYLKDYLIADENRYIYIEDRIDVEIKAPLNSISITNAEPMSRGETRSMETEFVYNQFDIVNDTDYPLVWSVSDKKLAEIDSEGNLTVKDTAKVNSTFKVTVTVRDGSAKKATATIKIV